MVCFTAACTKTVRVPAVDYVRLAPRKNHYLIVETAGARYRVERFTMTDSTLIMEKMIPPPGTYPARDLGFSEPSRLPYAVPLASIESISQVKRTSNAVGPLVLLGMVAVFYLFAMYLFGEGLSGLGGT